jgi:hypothetical protein
MTRRIKPLWERVWAKVETGQPGECWPWRGARSRNRNSRRPVISLGPRRDGRRPVARVARLICEWANGPAPTPFHEAGHTCPNGERSECVNPFHLAWMTRHENEQHKQTYRIPDECYR